jgi:hypothetical protein
MAHKKTIQCYADQTLLDKLTAIAGHYRRNISSTIRELIEMEYIRLTQQPTEVPTQRNLLGD